MKSSTHSGGPFELEVRNKGGFDLERLFRFDIHQNDGAGLAHRNEERFAHREIVAGIDQRGGFRMDDQRTGQAFGGQGAAVHVKCEMKVSENFKRIDPSFRLSTFVAEKARAHPDYGKKFPRAN